MARSVGWVLTLLVVFVFILVWVKRQWSSPATHRVHPKPSPRPLKPRTPDDCLACRVTPQPHLVPASTTLKPYSQVISRRGPLREKRIATAGYACPNSGCLYSGITDEHIHALVGYGGHGHQEYIRALRLKCQACRTKFSVRYGTALYRLKTPARRVGEGLSALGRRLERRCCRAVLRAR
jgi:hypothetical protein